MRLAPVRIAVRPEPSQASAERVSYRETGRRMVLTAAIWALVASLGEGAVQVVHLLVPNHEGYASNVLPEIFWIAPLLNLPVFLGLGLLLRVPARLMRRLLPGRLREELVLSALCGALAAYLALLALQSAFRWVFYPIAVGILCVGIGVQVYRALSRRPEPSEATLRRDLLRLAGVTVVANLVGLALARGPARSLGSLANAEAGLSGLLAGTLAQREVLASGAAQGGTRPPNVLLIVLDTLRADHLTSYGYSRPTSPALDAFAREGVLFERAYSTASWTLASHATMFTARHLNEHRAASTPLDARYPTLAEYLAERGYATAGFVANMGQTSRAAGVARGFQVYEDYFYGPLETMQRTAMWAEVLGDPEVQERSTDLEQEKDAAGVNRQFLSWLETRRPAPFFAFLNYFDVHAPYKPRPPFSGRFTDDPPLLVEMRPRLPGPVDRPRPRISGPINRYDEEILALDTELGVLFERLRALGILDDTLVLITADHGEEFLEHDEDSHGKTLYKEVLHVPLIVRYPARVPTGARLAPVVSLQAIPATVLQLTGLESGSPFPGSPLTGYWAEREAGEVVDDRGIAFSELDYHREGKDVVAKSLVADDWHLIVYHDGTTMLFNTDRDPREWDDLRGTEEGGRVVAELGARLEQFLPSEEWEQYRRFVG